MTETAVPTRPRVAQRSAPPRLAVFWVAASISNAGSWMQAVAVPALVYDLTGKAAWLGYRLAGHPAPAVFLSPYAGVLRPSHPPSPDPAHHPVGPDGVRTEPVVALRADRITPGLILALGFVTGIATGFQTAAWQ